MLRARYYNKESPKTGKWVIREIKIWWYCRTCWKKGVVAISIPAPRDGEPEPKDIVTIVEMVSYHPSCLKSDLRMLNYAESNEAEKKTI